MLEISAVIITLNEERRLPRALDIRPGPVYSQGNCNDRCGTAQGGPPSGITTTAPGKYSPTRA